MSQFGAQVSNVRGALMRRSYRVKWKMMKLRAQYIGNSSIGRKDESKFNLRGKLYIQQT